MSFRSITDETGWEESRHILRFTSAAVKACEEHEQLAKPLDDLLDEWNLLDALRRTAEDAVVDANAVVSAMDGKLDIWVGRLVARVLLECDQSRSNPTFKKYFPEPPNEIIRMALENEIERTRKFHLVAAELGASKEIKAILAEISAIQERGKKVLGEREDAVSNRARIALRIQTWKENANAVRRSAENLLDAYAIENHLPRDYSDDFFPSPGRTPRKQGDAEHK